MRIVLFLFTRGSHLLYWPLLRTEKAPDKMFFYWYPTENHGAYKKVLHLDGPGEVEQ